ncbi:MAG: hypothetical protein P9F75_12085 [Candidatus Contendobacter sp.]|nr:hypothetical protein [Candidatus Contendobacter sp.]
MATSGQGSWGRGCGREPRQGVAGVLKAERLYVGADGRQWVGQRCAGAPRLQFGEAVEGVEFALLQ